MGIQSIPISHNEHSNVEVVTENGGWDISKAATKPIMPRQKVTENSSNEDSENEVYRTLIQAT